MVKKGNVTQQWLIYVCFGQEWSSAQSTGRYFRLRGTNSLCQWDYFNQSGIRLRLEQDNICQHEEKYRFSSNLYLTGNQ